MQVVSVQEFLSVIFGILSFYCVGKLEKESISMGEVEGGLQIC